MTVTLDVTKREKGTARTSGVTPGIVYGPKQEPVSLAVNAQVFEKILHDAGESTIITLKGLGNDIEVLIHDVAFNAEKGGVEHVDFYAIERGKELTTNVGLEFIGEAPVEKTGATINKVLHDIEVTCRPKDLPSHIDVDVTVLVGEDSEIRVEDLIIPEGVKVENDPEDIVANVSAAREEEPEPETESVDMDAIEVEGKGKGDEEGASSEENKEEEKE
jgi:large subunit ribosomal protein L25